MASEMVLNTSATPAASSGMRPEELAGATKQGGRALGQPLTFDQVLEESGDGVFYTCLSVLRDFPHLVQDAEQQSMLKAWQSLQRGTQVDFAGSWMRMIARNAALDVLRGELRHHPKGIILIEEPISDEGRLAAETMRTVEVEDLLGKVRRYLKPRQIRILGDVLAGRSQKDIAEDLGVTPPALSYQLNAIKSRIRALAEDPDGDGDGGGSGSRPGKRGRMTTEAGQRLGGGARGNSAMGAKNTFIERSQVSEFYRLLLELPAFREEETEALDPEVRDLEDILRLLGARPADRGIGADLRAGFITGTVWKDIDGDAVREAGEPGFGGVTVSLRSVGGALTSTTTTDGAGRYVFGDLSPGSYTIDVKPPEGSWPTFDLDGTLDNTTTVSVTSAEVTTGVDFGYQPIGGVRIAADVGDRADGRNRRVRQSGGSREYEISEAGVVPADEPELVYESTRHLEEGEIVTGTVVDITSKEVGVDIGCKSEGLIPISEFTDRNGTVKVEVGDEVEVLLEK
ncbi:MAG: S1 RNA-binding domain-containing protein, partial [bacterium]|nr:S1 RNA-binding domain-containing protein [bacterium]